MLEQKRSDVALFGHALDGQMEKRTKIYLKLTIPNKGEEKRIYNQVLVGGDSVG